MGVIALLCLEEYEPIVFYAACRNRGLCHLISSASLSANTNYQHFRPALSRCTRIVDHHQKRNEMREGSAGAVLGRARSKFQRPALTKALTWVRLPRPGSGWGKLDVPHSRICLTTRWETFRKQLDERPEGADPDTSLLRAAEKGVVRGAGRVAAAFGTALVCLGAAPAAGCGSRSMSEADGLRQLRPSRPQVITDDGQTPEAKDQR